MTEQLAIPRVRTGGTPREMLVDQHVAAMVALETALLAVQRAAPNARDFAADLTLFDRAVAQHRARLRLISAVCAEIETICSGVAA